MTPTIHLNGTDAKELIEQRMTALRALVAAEQALTVMSPNGRDYPEPGSYGLAAAEHEARAKALRDMRRAIEGEVMDLRDAVDEREARKAALR